MDQLEPASVRYNVALALLFTGPLDVEILKQCLNEIVRRHESLRTVITVVDGRPCQNLVPSITLDLPVVDLGQSISEATLDSAIQQFIAGQAQRPFDLSSGPLLRSSLLSLEPDRQVLLLTLHHIAFDGWSGAIMLREIASLYCGFFAAQISKLARFAHSVFGLRRVAAPLIARLFARRFAGLLEKAISKSFDGCALPTDRPRPNAQSCRGARQIFFVERNDNPALSTR